MMMMFSEQTATGLVGVVRVMGQVWLQDQIPLLLVSHYVLLPDHLMMVLMMMMMMIKDDNADDDEDDDDDDDDELASTLVETEY